MRSHASLMCDISDWQAGFDAYAYRRSGRVAIMIKACEGRGFAGASHHAQRAIEAHGAGLRVVHYAFLDASPGADQAAVLRQAVEPVWRPGDRLCADVEVQGAPGALGAWRAALEASGHSGLLLYTYRGFTGSWMGAAKGMGLILADYGWSQLPSLLDRLAAHGLPLAGRQFTDGVSGADPHMAAGISGPVDCTRLTSWGRRLIEA